MAGVVAGDLGGRLPVIGRLLALSLFATAFVQPCSISMAAASQEEPAVRRFDIPAQPLVKALEVYGAASGVQVLYESGLASGSRSAELHGRYNPLVALRVLLEGTGLVVHLADTGDVVLAPRILALDRDGPAAGPGEQILMLDPLKVTDAQDGAYRTYVGVVESEIQKALQRDERTRSGSYKVGLMLWFGSTGAVLRSSIASSTGSRDRDDAIADALGTLTISQAPPADMPQPVAIRIVAHSR